MGSYVISRSTLTWSRDISTNRAISIDNRDISAKSVIANTRDIIANGYRVVIITGKNRRRGRWFYGYIWDWFFYLY
jgi:hypothetical protein